MQYKDRIGEFFDKFNKKYIDFDDFQAFMKEFESDIEERDQIRFKLYK